MKGNLILIYVTYTLLVMKTNEMLKSSDYNLYIGMLSKRDNLG